MRLKALQDWKYKEIPDAWIMLADEVERGKEKSLQSKITLVLANGTWDTLANEWEAEKLDEWGLYVPIFETDDDINFNPNLEPTTNYSDVTKEQIQKEAEKISKSND